ncbi:aldo/keto reductase [Streptomyces sp. NBC_01264]|uniref:aldo/keto reductase n=1 Tax=Streptomyces sp. NBC_01264 TaxID=2903804 RepID=UPI00224CDC81|nr:aldo/keto reductase [Streptomyces sp. NBC_01264]MCX4783968.1 aldo/keto reductase [Streptomyces sp. NBC_01264]
MTDLDLTSRHLGQGLLAHPLGVNLGAVGLPGNLPRERDDGPFLDGLRRAVELGANLLDTADSYGAGRAERLVGRLLREYPDRTFLTSSKVGRIRGSAPHAYADRHIHHQLQQTLENLYAEELDLYTLDSWDFGPQDRYLGTAIDQMHTLREVGAIKAIGMQGPYTPAAATPAERAACAERFLHLFRLIRPNVLWTRCNALTPVITLEGEDLFAFTARHGVGVILAAPKAPGLRAGLTPSGAETVPGGLEELHTRFGDAPGTLTRLALLSGVQRAGHCATVVGFSSETQLEESFGTLSGPVLTAGELRTLDDAYARARAQMHPKPKERLPAGTGM